MSIEIAICDANEQNLEYYTNLCLNIAKNNEITLNITPFKSGTALLFEVADYSEKNIDIIFIDINLLNEDGIEIVKELRKKHYENEIVFLTKSKDYFRQAFDLSAFNYIVKKEDKDTRFQDVFLRAIKSVKEKNKEYIVFNNAGEYRCIAIDEIEYFEVINRIITVYYSGESFEFISTLNKLEAHLAPMGFVRSQKSYLVNTEKIKSFSFKNIELYGGKQIPIGRAYYSKLKEQMPLVV